MKKAKDLYLHQTGNNWTNINYDQEWAVWNNNTRRYDTLPGKIIPNTPFLYRMEFISLCYGYHAVTVKLSTAPIPELIDAKVLLDGDVFEDLLKHAQQIHSTDNTVYLVDVLVFKNKGTIKLCR